MKILYLGSPDDCTTSGHRVNALKRLGHHVDCIDIPSLLKLKGLISKFHYRTGYRFLQNRLLSQIRKILQASNRRFELIWVDGGQYFGPLILKWLRHAYVAPIILYNVDDPTGTRDSCQYDSLKDSLYLYSLCVVVRQETALEVLALGAKMVVAVSRSFDEAAHFVQSLVIEGEESTHRVSFIGTNIPGEKRDLFLLTLLLARCPIQIIGDRWRKSRFWHQLKANYKGKKAIGAEYVSFIKCSAVCLGLLSHQNRDLITTRSLEIPACSGLFCAERTSEHQLYYEDQKEAFFWSDSEECVQVTSRLLADSNLRAAVRSAGAKHVMEMGVGNEDMCSHVLSVLENMAT